MSPLQNFFYPRSICVAGAIRKEKSIGYELLKCIHDYGYTGRILPVNPSVDNVLGYKCFHSIEEVDEEIDLGIRLSKFGFNLVRKVNPISIHHTIPYSNIRRRKDQDMSELYYQFFLHPTACLKNVQRLE